MDVTLDTLPRAADMRPAKRADRRGGRPYIGPKVQMNVPGEQYDFVLDLMAERGWDVDRYSDALREVFAAGVLALRSARGGA